jgi:hypothetical protein
MSLPPLQTGPSGTPDYYLRITQVVNLSNYQVLAAAGISFAVGYTQYIYNALLLHHEKTSPFPLWMHTFYLAHDATWAIKFYLAAPAYDWHWFLLGTSVALCIWVCLEMHSLYKAITVERQSVFGPLFPKSKEVTMKQAIIYIVQQVAMMCALLQIGVAIMGEGCFLQWAAITNLWMVMGLTPFIMSRGSRKGFSCVNAIATVVGTAATFAPQGFFVQILPEVFDKMGWYVAGLIMTWFSIWNVILLLGYPPKPQALGMPPPIW